MCISNLMFINIAIYILSKKKKVSIYIEYFKFNVYKHINLYRVIDNSKLYIDPKYFVFFNQTEIKVKPPKTQVLETKCQRVAASTQN